MESSVFSVVLGIFGVVVLLVFLFLYLQNRALNLKILEIYNEIDSKSRENFRALNDEFENKITNLNANLNQTLTNLSLTSTNSLSNSMDSRFLNLNERFKDIALKMDELESSNQVVGSLKSEISKLNAIFNNQKLRGNFGEFELIKILKLSYGENQNLYETQKTLSNFKIVDVALKLRDDLILPIDSKFPLSSYERVVEALENGDKVALNLANKSLINDMKKHIDDIASRYILPPETTEFGVLFLPSEVVFSYICGNLAEILSYASKNSVFISSPTTLLAMIHSFNIFIKDEKISENLTLLKAQIFALNKEFEIYKKQNKDAINYATRLTKALETIKENSDKISSHFDKIAKI